MSRKQRSYQLIFGDPIIIPSNFFEVTPSPLTVRGDNPLISLETFYSEINPNAYLINKHNISFRITKSEKANNKAEITVDNLSESTIGYLMSHRSESLVIMLKVGYDDNIKLLFQGTMSDCLISKSGETSKTKLILSDGKFNTSQAYSSRIFPTGTKAQRIVDDLLLDLGMPKGRVVEIPPAKVITTPYSVMGKTYESLERFLEGQGYTPTINNGFMYVLQKGFRFTDNVASITPESGLIGNVQPLIPTDSTKTVTDSKTESGFNRIRFSCQMDATLNPQSSVYVKDPETGVDGAFKIEKSVFQCTNYESGSWFVTVDAVAIDATVATF